MMRKASEGIIVRLPGRIIEAFELQDRNEWPDSRVVEIKRHARGFSVFVAGSREGLQRFRAECLRSSTYRPEGPNLAYDLAIVCQVAKHKIDAALKASSA